MSQPCSILAADVVTSLGAGCEEVWSQMMRGTCGLRPMKRFPHGKYRTDVAGEIPDEVMAGLAPHGAGADETRAYALALGVGRRLVRALPADLPRQQTGLVLATTKAEIDELHHKVLSREIRDATLFSIKKLSVFMENRVASLISRERFNPFVMARDLARDLGLAGPVLAVSSACASGSIAIIQAARLLTRGEADRVLVIGVDVLADFILAGFSALAALSRGPCRPFDQSRDGLSLGEGAGALLLARAPDRGSPLAILRGWGMTGDACHITAPSRTGEGLRRALLGALAMAGLAPQDIHYINSHGTGTVYNDEMEAEALGAVFGEAGPPVSSMKGYFGHTLGAAGVIEAALCLKVLRERAVPASMGLTDLGVGRPINVTRVPLRPDPLDNLLTIKCGFGGVNAVLAISRA